MDIPDKRKKKKLMTFDIMLEKWRNFEYSIVYGTTKVKPVENLKTKLEILAEDAHKLNVEGFLDLHKGSATFISWEWYSVKKEFKTDELRAVNPTFVWDLEQLAKESADYHYGVLNKLNSFKNDFQAAAKIASGEKMSDDFYNSLLDAVRVEILKNFPQKFSIEMLHYNAIIYMKMQLQKSEGKLDEKPD